MRMKFGIASSALRASASPTSCSGEEITGRKRHTTVKIKLCMSSAFATSSSKRNTCRVQNPDIPWAGRGEAVHGRAAGRGGARKDGKPTGRSAQETIDPLALQSIEDNCDWAQQRQTGDKISDTKDGCKNAQSASDQCAQSAPCACVHTRAECTGCARTDARGVRCVRARGRSRSAPCVRVRKPVGPVRPFLRFGCASSRCLTARPPSAARAAGRPPQPRQLRELAPCLSQAGGGGLKFAAAPACFKVSF